MLVFTKILEKCQEPPSQTCKQKLGVCSQLLKNSARASSPPPAADEDSAPMSTTREAFLFLRASNRGLTNIPALERQLHTKVEDAQRLARKRNAERKRDSVSLKKSQGGGEGKVCL